MRSEAQQQAALKALQQVECKVNAAGCDGQWCEARRNVLVAFGVFPVTGGKVTLIGGEPGETGVVEEPK